MIGQLEIMVTQARFSVRKFLPSH